MSQSREMAEAMELDNVDCEFFSELSFKKYLLDYLKRKGMHNTAEIFAKEANVPLDPVAIDSPPNGFLSDWWEIFSAMYFSRQPKGSPSTEMPSSSTKGKGIQSHDRQVQESWFDRGPGFDHVRRLNMYPASGQNHIASDVAPRGVLHRGMTKVFQNTQNNQNIQDTHDPQKPFVQDGFTLAQSEEVPVPARGGYRRSLSPISKFLTGATQVPADFELQAPSMQGLSAMPPAILQGNLQPLGESSLLQTGNVMQSSGNDGENAEPVIALQQSQNDQSPSLGQEKQTEHPPYSKSGDGSDADIHATPPNQDESKGLGLVKVASLNLSRGNVLCVDFSSDGKLLASAGHETKVLLWNMVDFTHLQCQESHRDYVTDLRFSPKSTIFATSSLDGVVRIWDADKPNKSISKLPGHREQVTSVDFHPINMELLSSCDRNGDIRIWNVNSKNCISTFEKVASRRVRFQPQEGKLLAGVRGDVVNVLDVETRQLPSQLMGHREDVRSVCWDTTGKYIASVSEDCVIVWSSSSDSKYLYKLQSNGNKFQSCIFLPGHEFCFVIGGYKNLEWWSPMESNKTSMIPAHGDLISELACSPKNVFLASASHDHSVNLWKVCHG